MDRIYASGAAAGAPGLPPAPSSGYPSAGNPSTGTPATKPGPYWYHMIMEELMAVIVAGGVVPAPGTLTQLKQALDALYQAKGNTLPGGYISGLMLVNNGTAQLDFHGGRARDAGNAFDMVLAATMTKTLQAAGAWAAGTGNNGLFSGSRANSTWYHAFLIRKAADGSTDCGFDTSITAANIPAGYTAYRRLGSIKTDASGNIIGFLQFKDEFWWKAAINDVQATTLSTASVTYSISVPPGLAVVADLMLFGGATDSNILVRGPDQSDVTTGTPMAGTPATITNIVGPSEAQSGTHAKIITNTSGQIAARSDMASTKLYVWTRGWRDSI